MVELFLAIKLSVLCGKIPKLFNHRERGEYTEFMEEIIKYADCVCFILPPKFIIETLYKFVREPISTQIVSLWKLSGLLLALYSSLSV